MFTHLAWDIQGFPWSFDDASSRREGWSDASLRQLMDGADRNGKGQVQIEDFVHWIFNVPVPAADQDQVPFGWSSKAFELVFEASRGSKGCSKGLDDQRDLRSFRLGPGAKSSDRGFRGPSGAWLGSISG